MALAKAASAGGSSEVAPGAGCSSSARPLRPICRSPGRMPLVCLRPSPRSLTNFSLEPRPSLTAWGAVRTKSIRPTTEPVRRAARSSPAGELDWLKLRRYPPSVRLQQAQQLVPLVRPEPPPACPHLAAPPSSDATLIPAPVGDPSPATWIACRRPGSAAQTASMMTATAARGRATPAARQRGRVEPAEGRPQPTARP
jgi:hypothetical protein